MSRPRPRQEALQESQEQELLQRDCQEEDGAVCTGMAVKEAGEEPSSLLMLGCLSVCVTSLMVYVLWCQNIGYALPHGRDVSVGPAPYPGVK
jgi:hypothetical protein